MSQESRSVRGRFCVSKDQFADFINVKYLVETRLCRDISSSQMISVFVEMISDLLIDTPRKIDDMCEYFDGYAPRNRCGAKSKSLDLSKVCLNTLSKELPEICDSTCLVDAKIFRSLNALHAARYRNDSPKWFRAGQRCVLFMKKDVIDWVKNKCKNN